MKLKQRWKTYGKPMLYGMIGGMTVNYGIRALPAARQSYAAGVVAAACVAYLIGAYMQLCKAYGDMRAHREELRRIFSNELNKFKDEVLREIVPPPAAERIRRMGQGGWLN